MRTKLLICSIVGIVLTVSAYAGYAVFVESQRERAGFKQVDNGDAQFWLFQGPPNDRYIPVTVDYHFDLPVDEDVVLARLKSLAGAYEMFQRNVVEFGGIPYWQSAEADWSVLFQVLDEEDDLDAMRTRAEVDVSQRSDEGAGLPLFRVFLSADRKQLTFVWHHVLSDLEGMFNKHAVHLFEETGERTRFGYQISDAADVPLQEPAAALDTVSVPRTGDARQLGFTGTNYDVTGLVLPVGDSELHALGEQANLPMSDIFSLITVRAISRYHEADDYPVRPVISPLSLRKSSLDLDEGNNRSIKSFPVVFPLETIDEAYRRVLSLEPTTSSYDAAGRMLKVGRRLSFLEPRLRRATMPDYISNYFPLADGQFSIGNSVVIRHDLRVPMVPYERAKFAWSNYDGAVQLFLHTDPELIDTDRMVEAFEVSAEEVLQFLGQ